MLAGGVDARRRDAQHEGVDQATVLRRLREEEERIATGWVGRKGQEDPAGALRELLAKQLASGVPRVEVRVRQEDPYLRAFFMTLSHRYGLQPFRKPRQRRENLTLEAPEPFLQDVLWPLYQACTALLQGGLSTYGLVDDFRDEGQPSAEERVDD